MTFRRKVKFALVLQATSLLASCMKDTLYDVPYPDMKAVFFSMMRLSEDNNVLDIDGMVADITGSSFTNPDRVRTAWWATNQLSIVSRCKLINYLLIYNNR